MKQIEKSGRIYHAATYIRLSKENGEENMEKSNSIKNQKDLIKSYLSDKEDIIVCMECVDNGYSGTDFDRPNFKHMMREIETGKIDCIIVKDLSRFGRNFIETGRYLEQIFPALGIRFIAINDGFDSIRERTSSDRILISFKNLLNDAYCRDISVKIRSQLEIKRKKGEFIGSFAIYGYCKNPVDRHKLVIDDYAASVVRDIFRWKLEGASQQRIADRLNSRGELSPMEYKRFCGLNYQSGFQINPKAKWTAVTVGRILQNECYIGTLIQGKRTTPNHKVKKIIQKPAEEWVRIENNHASIVDKEVFYTVKSLLLQDMRVAPKAETVSLFSGLIFCGDCCQNMVLSSVRQNGKTYRYYMCRNNRINHVCTSHRICESVLKELIVYILKQSIKINIESIESLKTYLFYQENMQKADLDARIIKKQEEIARYSHLKKSLYESMTNGLLSKTEYWELKTVYDTKIQEAQRTEEEQKKDRDNLLKNCSDYTAWIEAFQQHQNRTELLRPIVVALIDRIDIYEGCGIKIHMKHQDSYLLRNRYIF